MNNEINKTDLKIFFFNSNIEIDFLNFLCNIIIIRFIIFSKVDICKSWQIIKR